MNNRARHCDFKGLKINTRIFDYFCNVAAFFVGADILQNILVKIGKRLRRKLRKAYLVRNKKNIACVLACALASLNINAQVRLESQVNIADNGLYFDGVDLDYSNLDEADTGEKYDFFFGRSISAHGDAVKTYKHYVFMTWYRGGKNDRHVMLTRLNTQTGATVDIEFPHRHTGFRGDPNIGESHNTIGLAVSPINGTIHMVYDMHAYDDNNYDGKFKDDFFRYSFSLAGTADLPDEAFTLDKFVKDTSAISQGDDDYKHLTMTGDIADKGNFARLTYPKFFKTDDGTLLLYMRLGGNNNGAYLFNRYDAETQTWSNFTKFNENNQNSKGNEYNWGLYGNMKYLNGKLRVGFQQRSSDNNDKYKYQNGVYYAYSDHPDGFGEWFNHRGEQMTWPLVNSDEIKVFEPGDYISHEQANSVYIVQDFDWTVTARGDIHIISLVQTNTSASDAEEFGFSDIQREKVYIHSYKPAGADEFIITTDFVGATSIYTSGNNVYIIGLNGGKPYVEVAEGGTNSFSRVYSQTDGPTFAHGTVYIEQGKIYYYLMERGEGSALPLHLQVIDLDIPTLGVSFEQSKMTLIEGYTSVSISAVPSIEDASRSVESIALYIDDKLVAADNTAPYSWTNEYASLRDLAEGLYNLKVIVTDSMNETAEASTTLSVVDPIPRVSFSQEDYQVMEDYDSLSLSIDASTPVAERTISQVELYINDNLIRVESLAPYEWGHTGDFTDELLNFPVGNHSLKAIVTDSEGLTSEAVTNLSVQEIIVPPALSFTDGPQTIEEEYSQLSFAVEASSPMASRTIEHVTLYINDTEIFQLISAPYQWTNTMSGLNSLPVGTHDVRAVATDSLGLKSEITMQIIVTAKPTAPTPSTPLSSESSSSSSGGTTPPLLLTLITLIILLRRYR